jgi:hypothetical protein
MFAINMRSLRSQYKFYLPDLVYPDAFSCIFLSLSCLALFCRLLSAHLNRCSYQITICQWYALFMHWELIIVLTDI